MTIEEFRERMSRGPSVEELRERFDNRITALVNNIIDDRHDIHEMKARIEMLESTVKDLLSKIDHDDGE